MKYMLVILLVLAGAVSAEVYKWTDDAGQVHFSDKPHDEKAEKITLKTYPPKSTDESTDEKKTNPVSSKMQVTMYATSWCGYCKKAREYFTKNNIPFIEYDIEKNAQAKRKYDSFGGKGVPVIFVGEQRMNGFNVASFNEIYKEK